MQIRARLPTVPAFPWLLALLLATSSVHAATKPPPTITVGTVTLNYCNTLYTGYCGSIKRALDPTGSVPGAISIGFELYPRSDQSRPALGTILPQEGGPGYSSTGTRDAYINMFRALRDRRDILIVDKRGTGTSGAIDCPDLQVSDPSDPAALAACAKQLGKKASLYGTSLAAADIVAVMDALQISEVDFYGDSYGTYFGQVLAARHPGRLRSIILDSAYPVRPPDAWFPTDWATVRDGLDLVCSRSPSCRSLGEPATTRIKALLREIRRKPISGTAPDADGVAQDVTLDVSQLLFVMFSVGYSPSVYRDLDAAARAWFDSGDSTPLLRLVAEFNTSRVSDPADYSAALYATVACGEYPLLYSLNASPKQRRQQYAEAIEEVREDRSGLFAPFTIDEALASNLDITPLDTCLDWPVPLPAYPQGDPLPRHPSFPPVPTLVLSGDLDAVTSPQDGAQAASQFPDVVHLLIPNLTHVTAWTFSDTGYLPNGGDLTHCVGGIVRRFINQLSPGDTSCIAKVRPIRTVPRFARLAEDLAPAQPTSGNQGGARELRLAAGALETVGDVISRFLITFGGGGGLRGGTFSYTRNGSGYDFDLNRVRWTEDLEVSGTIHWNQLTDVISSDVRLRRSGRNAGQLKIVWNDRQRDAVAALTGKIGDLDVKARRIAP
jgi:pimeloyl-ACP methyl ester carboxylesterase